jgi:4-diphosphocytidyl-2-C-methyl-D-erythritol kinase
MITYPNVKVNLGLSVLRKRSDGYHDIETLFVPYHGIHDNLEIIPGDDFSRTSASLFERFSLPSSGGVQPRKTSFGPPPSKLGSPPLMLPRVAQFSEAGTSGTSAQIPQSQKEEGLSKAEGGTVFSGTAPDGGLPIRQGIREDGKVMVTIAREGGVDWDPLEDLTVKAYGLLDDEFGLPPVKIFLEKGAPVGAGLGGGSADAASALRTLSELFGLGLDEPALAARAARLGSDCPFFVYNRPMLGTGRGEVLEPYDIDLSAWELRIAVPEGVRVGTADAYRGITPREAAGGRALPLREALSRPVAEWRGRLVNDFETTVFAKFPAVAAAKQALYDAGAVYASMSGSGSAVYGLFPR